MTVKARNTFCGSRYLSHSNASKYLYEWFFGADADTDVDFDPTADMLIHDYDDERTLDEEEAMSNEESVANELDDLQKVRRFGIFVLLYLIVC